MKEKKEKCKNCGSEKVIKIEHDPLLGNWQDMVCPKCDRHESEPLSKEREIFSNIMTL